MSNLEHEENVCRAVIHLMEMITGETISEASRPERENRTDKTVEILLDSASGGYALEHTRIETFSDQLLYNHSLDEFRQLFAAEVNGSLPSEASYKLVLPFEAVRGSLKQRSQIRSQLKAWMIDKAPSLEVGSPKTAPLHYIREIPPGLFFEVALYCWPKRPASLHILLELPASSSDEQLETLTRHRIQTAFDKKCSKLQEWKQMNDSKRKSILVLEESDLQLANPPRVTALIADELSKLIDNIPDHVFLVSTALPNQWELYTVKQNDFVLSHHSESSYEVFSYELDKISVNYFNIIYS